MKLSRSIILLSLLGIGSDALSVQRGQLSMRVAKNDLFRRQKFNKILSKTDENPSTENVSAVLLSEETGNLIQKCNWKVRNSMLLKVRNIADATGVELDPEFGVPPSQSEKELIDQENKAKREESRVARRIADEANAKAQAEAKAANKAARIERTKEALARATEAKKLVAPPVPDPSDDEKSVPAVSAEPEPVAVSEPTHAAAEPVAVAASDTAAPEPVTVAATDTAAPEPVAVAATDTATPEPVAVTATDTAAPEPVAVAATDIAAPEPDAVAATDTAATSGGDITPKRIKELRDATGAGMMDCKKALIDANGDMEAATEVLRAKGLAKADKKASRIAAEGKIAAATSGNKAVLVEINCETDFVAKDSSFAEFTKGVAGAALSVSGDNVDDLLSVDINGSTVEETRQALVAKIGENIQVRRLVGRGGSDTTVGAYVHMNRIGVLVEIEGGNAEVAEDVAMHVAAMNPPFAKPEDVPQAVLEKEREFLTQQALDSGKPKEIVEKMIEGRIRKYLEEICLVSQTYVKTNDKTVGKLLAENGAKMIGFTRIEVGEGIEKRQDDFAAEVAKMAGISSTPEPVTLVESEPVAVSEPTQAAPEPVAVAATDIAAPEPDAVAATDTAATSGGDITPKRIKELRDATGAGMMDCKKALIDANGDMEAATEVLRAKGLAKADKKASRIAAEGKIAAATSGNKAVLVEINCETDFVAKDSSFAEFTKGVAGAALSVSGDNVDDLLSVDINGSTVEETRQALVAKIGENIQVRRLVGRGGSDTTVGAYVHMNRIGVLVEIEGGNAEVAEDVAMHVAAMNPPFAKPEDVPQAVLEKEREFLTQQALDSGKPKEIVEKMIEGRIRKYLEEICLVSQTYVKTNDKTVGKLLAENGAKMIGFTRIEVGEGIEKRQDDFAAEVAKMAAGAV